MSKHPSALLALLSHAAAGCQALHLGAPARADVALDLSAADPGDVIITPHGSLKAVNGCVSNWNVGGRVGNQFSGLADALFVAEMCGVPCVEVSGWEKEMFRDFLDLPDFINVDSPYSHDNTSALCKQAVQHMQETHNLWADLPPMDWAKKLLTKHMWPRLKKTAIDGLYREDTLVIHLRGDDTLRGEKGDGFYMPAPCSFFKDVMETGWQGKPFARVVAISEHDWHPCLSILGLQLPNRTSLLAVASDEEGAHRHTAPLARSNSTAFAFDAQAHSVVLTRLSPQEDFMYLAAARNVAWSASSTFGMNGVMMNPHDVVNVFMPTYEGVNGTVCCDGDFKQSRLEELCRIGELSRIYEIPFPTGYQLIYPEYWGRRYWLENETIPMSAFTIHRCNETNLHGGS